MRFLRKNTAVIVSVGPFYDKTDGVTIKTALTITNEKITLVADTDDNSAPTNILDNVTGATSGTSNDLNYITANDAGMMQLELAAADTNRNGRLLLSITDAVNHVPVFHEFTILPAAIYDWLIAGTVANVPADVQAMASGVITATVVADNTIDAGAIAADAITAAKIANGAIDAATFAAGAIDATAIATGAIDADALASDAVTEIRSVASGTSDSGSTTTMVDAARTEADTDYWKGDSIVFTSGTIAGQARFITAFDPATDTITFAPATTAAVGTQTYEIWPAGRADLQLVKGSVINDLISGRVDANTQAMAANVITSSVIAADAIGASQLADNAIDSGAIAADAITAAKIATDAIGASEFAQGAADKVWSSTTRNLTTTPGIKKNTALSAFEVFMRDSTDHVSGKTGLTLTEEVSIDGAAFAALTNNAVEVANGIYKIDLAAADLNGNVVTLKFTATGADATFVTVITDR